MPSQTLWTTAVNRVKPLLSAVGCLLVVAFIVLRWGFPEPSLSIRLSAKSADQQGFRLFYAVGQGGFTEEQSTGLLKAASREGGFVVYQTHLRTAQPITRVRLDPLPSTHNLSIGSFELRSSKGTLRLGGQELATRAEVSEGLALIDSPSTESPSDERKAEGLFRVSGEDPHWILPVPDTVIDRQSHLLSKLLRVFTSWWTLAVGLGVLWLAHQALANRWFHGALALFTPWADALGRHTGSRIGPGAVAVLLIFPILFAVSVSLKLHNSSVGMWYGKFGVSQSVPSMEIGEPQEIRSDEWFVHTPWLLNQVQTGMKTFNPNLGPDGTTLVTSMPVKHLTAIAQPQFWGYMWLDLERGYSWNWTFRALSLIGSVFVLLLLLTRGQTTVSLATSLAIYGSSFVQWWYSSWITEIITGLAGALVGVFVWTHSRNPKFIYAAALLAALAGMHVVLQPYLPFLASLAILGGFMGLAIGWESHRAGLLTQKINHRLLAIAIASVVFAALFWSYYAAAKIAIDGIMNTVYPGKRVVLGGDIPLHDYLLGFFEFWRNKYEQPHPLLNPSEVSRFLFLFPFVALVAAVFVRRVTFGPVFWSMLAYCALAVTWMSVPLPAGMRSAIAALGMEYIPPVRMYAGLGVASWLLAAVAFARIQAQSTPRWGNTGWVVATAVASVALAWSSLLLLNPDFYTWQRLAIAWAVVASVLWAICRSKAAPFLAGVVLVIAMPLTVNPVTSGLSHLLDKALFEQTRALDASNDEKWVVFGGSDLSQALRANGHQVITGVYFVPRFDIMRIFDPADQHQSVWNSYGSLGIESNDDPNTIVFKRHYDDSHGLEVHPCHASLEQLGVTRWVFDQPQDLGKLTCLKELRSFDPIDLYIYARKEAAN